jgi:hypothetical protein
MSRKQLSLSRSLVVVAALALTASSVAFADDSSMSRLTGDSYAYFNNLDYNPGKFNTARAPRTEEKNAVAKSPRKEQDKVEQRVMQATRPSRGTPANPFRNDTGA